jgi:hypothetical protein
MRKGEPLPLRQRGSRKYFEEKKLVFTSPLVGEVDAEGSG